MAAKKRSLLSSKIRKHLEEALLETLKRHIVSKATGGRRKKKAPARRKKPVRTKIGKKKRPAARRKRRA